MAKKMLPRLVYQMCVHGGLLAGSYARMLAGEKGVEPQDFDILVPHEKWQIIALLIPEGAKPNKFGGWRFVTDWEGEGVEVDVWPDSVFNYLQNCKSDQGKPVVVLDFIGNRAYSAVSVAI